MDKIIETLKQHIFDFTKWKDENFVIVEGGYQWKENNIEGYVLTIEHLYDLFLLNNKK